MHCGEGSATAVSSSGEGSGENSVLCPFEKRSLQIHYLTGKVSLSVACQGSDNAVE